MNEYRVPSAGDNPWILWALAVVVLSTAACAHGDVDAPPTPKDEFHFVVLGDSQFDDPATFNRTIDQVRMLRPAFVIQVGDLIDGYKNDLAEVKAEWARFRNQIAPLGPIPYFAVAGNHDLYNGEDDVDPKLEELFKVEWGDLHYYFRYKNAVFIVLNSDSSQLENGIDDEQLAWLRKVFQRNRARHTFVLMHKPLRFMVNGSEMHQLFVENGVDYVMVGHLHHYQYEQRDGVHYVMTNASGDVAYESAALGGLDHLLHVAVRDDEVSVAAIDVDTVRGIDAVAPTDYYDYLTLAKALTPYEIDARDSDNGRYAFDLALNNPIERSLEAYIFCNSEDNRWVFAPALSEPVRLGPKAMATVAMTAWFESGRVSESAPECHIEVPFRTAAGNWIRFEQTVSISVKGSVVVPSR